MEEITNKIKTMQKQTYGFREREFFQLAILNLHEIRNAFARNNLLDGFANYDYVAKLYWTWKGIDEPQGFAAG
jgi:hypothetical protein